MAAIRAANASRTASAWQYAVGTIGRASGAPISAGSSKTWRSECAGRAIGDGATTTAATNAARAKRAAPAAEGAQIHRSAGNSPRYGGREPLTSRPLRVGGGLSTDSIGERFAARNGNRQLRVAAPARASSAPR